jgi:putative SOS response-associated peptidase YedK
MCGRYTLKTNQLDVATLFDVKPLPDWRPRYNVAPTQMVACVRQKDSGRELVRLRWGLIPGWAKDPKIAYSLINTRSETAATKPSFRSAMKRRRCLIVADGFYEWKKVGKAKIPIHFHLRYGEPFAFAGLWEFWKPKDGDPIESCTIMTTEANTLVAPYHDRMPVILPKLHYEHWLDPKDEDSDKLLALLVPFPDSKMTATPANPIVNTPKNDNPECLVAPVEDAVVEQTKPKRNAK